MDQETLFTSSKWEILQELSKGERSPLELARKTSTSIANVSQQLRLLELGELVKSKRIKNRDKDKPRQLYSLSRSKAYLIAISPNFVDKKQIDLTDYHSVLLRILFLPNKELHYYVQRYFLDLEKQFAKITLIAVRDEYDKIRFLISSNDPSLKTKLKDQKITDQDGESKEIVVNFVTEKELAHVKKAGYYAIHDPQNIFKNEENTKKS